MQTKIFFPFRCAILAAFVTLAVSVFFAGPLGAGQALQKTSQSGAIPGKVQSWPHENSDLAPSPNVVFGTLENGFQYVMMKNPKPEDRVSMHLAVDVGSFHETEDQRGAAHFLEHMLFSGTEHFPPGSLVKYFQRIGMEFGPDVNGRTGFYETVYDLELPGGDKEMLDEAMRVMHDYAAKALLRQEEVTQERSVILSEKRTRDSPDFRTFKSTLQFELPDARISRRMPIGTESVIRKTDRELLKSFYDTWYRPERLTLIMVGDFSPEIAEKLIQKRFSGLEARAPENPVPGFGQAGHQGIAPFYHYESEAGNTRVSIETIAKHPLPPDSVAYQRGRLLAEMANQIVQHRIEVLLNKENTPFSEANISSGHYLRFVKAAEITADCAPENWEPALGAIEKTLRRALEHGFTASEVKRVQKEYTNRLEQAVKGAATRKSGNISRQILGNLNRDRVFQSPQQRQDLLQPAVDAATPAALQQALKNEWGEDHRLLLVTGNADLSGGETSPGQQIKNVYAQSREKSVAKPEESDQASFPYLSAPEKPGEIKSRQDIEDLGITRVVFENGITLMVKPTDFQDNQVLTAVSFGRGESAEPADFPALAEMAERVINESGLGQLNREELDQALAGKNTSVSFAVEDDKFVLSASSVPDETSLMFELLYTHLLDPGFRENAYSRATEQFRQRHKSLTHSVHGALALEGRRFLAGGDSRFGLPALDAVEKTDLADIREWVKPAFDKAPVEIAVVGDVQPDQVIDAAATFLGSLPERKAPKTPVQRGNPDFPEDEKRDISVPTRISKGLVMVAYPSTDIWDIHKTRRLSVLSNIFSDRMRIRIREEMGASYSQAAYNQPSRAYPDYGVFAVYALIDPNEAETVETAIREISGKLHEKGATKDELKRAIEPTLTGIRKQLKTNEYWLDTVLKGAARHPEQLDWSRSIKSDYAGITVEEINRLARKYLENAKAATLWIRPESTGADMQKPEPGKTRNEK